MESLICYTKNQAHVTEENIKECYPLVKKIAYHIKKRLPSSIDINDLLQSGYVGLLEAAKHYSPRKDATFATYASIRIHGAMIDFLRKNSWGSREAIKSMQRISEAINVIESKTKQAATTEQIMQELGVDVDEYARICQLATSCNINSLDFDNSVDNISNQEEENPDYLTEKAEIKMKLKAAMRLLPEKQQIVLSLYYIEELTLSQIGNVLDLTEARICQLHAQAIAKIHDYLGDSE